MARELTLMSGGAEEVLRMEEAFVDAFVSNDAEAMGRFLDEDWIIIASEGVVVDRKAFLEAVASGILTHEKLEMRGLQVRDFGGTAIVHGL
ncbi:MAG: nuclear transport factor 2 family protein, partial [Thermoplasmata archaeon]|nr:nuclear transport factor 2 family protein [Thermoplasmata archaeon]